MSRSDSRSANIPGMSKFPPVIRPYFCFVILAIVVSSSGTTRNATIFPFETIVEKSSQVNRAAHRMQKIGLSGLVLLATLAPATAASPLGNWLVEEKTAQIRIVDCASALWGVISWEKIA